MTTLRSTSSSAELAAELRQFCHSAPAHAPILPERRLAEQYGISHSTVRRVLAELLADGLIYKVQGSGNFVAECLPSHPTAATGVIVYCDTWKDPANRYRNQVIRGLATAAEALGCRLEILALDIHLSRGEALRATITRPDLHGLVLPWVPPELVEPLRRQASRLAVVATATPNVPDCVATVGVDFVGLGRAAAAAMAARGVNRPVGICAVPESGAGFWLGGRERGIACRVLDGDAATAPARWAERLLRLDPPGVFLDDDVHAAAILAACETARPGFCADRLIVSHANVGATGLPAAAVRLEFDGYHVGRLIVHTLDAIRRGDTPRAVSIRVRPTEVSPV